MKGLIDKSGFLWIERGGVMKEQYCRLHHAVALIKTASTGSDIVTDIKHGQIHCGDSCPLFGEPTIQDYGDNNKVIAINLCEMGWEFDTLTDERGK